jgi:imidazolonepropionase-like amidohydrolase
MKPFSALLRAAVATIVLIAAGCTAPASPPRPNLESPAAAPILAITDVTVIDVASGARRAGMTVLVKDGRIDSVGPARAVPRGALRIAGKGRFLIPGLWDMHSHHQASGSDSLPLFLANGVVGTRDMGSDLDFILPLRDRIARGEVAGPAIVAAGPILDAAPADWPYRRRVANAEEARTAVRALAKSGVDFIKVHDQTPRDAFFAIRDEAALLGLPFAGHVPAAVTIEEAAASGMASIEHLANNRLFLECSDGQSYDPAKCRPLFGRLAAAPVWQTPTLAFFQSIPDTFSGKPPPNVDFASPSLRAMWAKNMGASKLSAEVLAYLRSANLGALAAMRDMRSAGVPFLAGCDAMVPGFCLHDEMEWMTRAGLSPLEALRTATLNPARFLGREAVQGNIAPGMAADLVILDADPLADIGNTRRIAAVIVRGRAIGRAELANILARAKAGWATAPAR